MEDQSDSPRNILLNYQKGKKSYKEDKLVS